MGGAHHGAVHHVASAARHCGDVSDDHVAWWRRAASGISDFVVGDDWVMAVGVLVVLGIAAAVGAATRSWFVLIIGIPAVLASSLRRATARRR